MKYYKITIADLDPRCCHPRIDPKSPWLTEPLCGNDYKGIHELPIPMIVDNKYQPYDHLLGGQIISKKAFELMKSLNKNLTGFESQMYYNGDKIWDIYYTIIVPKYNFFNWEKSKYQTMKSFVSDKLVLIDIDKLIFDIEKLNQIQDDNFFTMEEEPVGIYCTEKAKKAIEDAGLIGFGFEEIPAE